MERKNKDGILNKYLKEPRRSAINYQYSRFNYEVRKQLLIKFSAISMHIIYPLGQKFSLAARFRLIDAQTGWCFNSN